MVGPRLICRSGILAGQCRMLGTTPRCRFSLSGLRSLNCPVLPPCNWPLHCHHPRIFQTSQPGQLPSLLQAWRCNPAMPVPLPWHGEPGDDERLEGATTSITRQALEHRQTYARAENDQVRTCHSNNISTWQIPNASAAGPSDARVRTRSKGIFCPLMTYEQSTPDGHARQVGVLRVSSPSPAPMPPSPLTIAPATRAP